MRRKAYLKPCYCEPGVCAHDEAPLLINNALEGVDQELKSAAGAGASEVKTKQNKKKKKDMRNVNCEMWN
jgi:hypothetical protein